MSTWLGKAWLSEVGRREAVVEIGGTVGDNEGLEIPVTDPDGDEVCGSARDSADLTSGSCSRDAPDDDDDDAAARAVTGADAVDLICVLLVRGQGAHFVECLGWEHRGHDVGLELDEKVLPQ